MGPEKFMETKECCVCGKEFSRLDYPSSFDRMITCGATVCAGQRRKERWQERYRKNKEHKQVDSEKIDLRKMGSYIRS